MGLRKTWVLFLAAALSFTIAYSQKGDYIATDSTLNTGINLFAGAAKDNSQFIRQKIKNGEKKYTPDQLTEYGFRDGTVFESKIIKLEAGEKRVFLERLATGTITLYRYVDSLHTIYYITKDSSELLEVLSDMESLKNQSQDCESMADAIKLAPFTKLGLRKLADRYNKCEQTPFPYIKYGIFAGYRQMKLVQPSSFGYTIIQDLSIPSSGSPLIGIFADFPIQLTEFSVHPELSFSSNNFSANSHTAQSDVDLLVSLHTLQLPLLARYTFPTPTWRLFVNAGPYFSYNIENSSQLYQSNISDNTITIFKATHDKLVADFLIGYSAGIGIQRNLGLRKTMFAEMRYTRAGSTDNTSLIQSAVDLIVGFTF
jgi:hypothetical protein